MKRLSGPRVKSCGAGVNVCRGCTIYPNVITILRVSLRITGETVLMSVCLEKLLHINERSWFPLVGLSPLSCLEVVPSPGLTVSWWDVSVCISTDHLAHRDKSQLCAPSAGQWCSWVRLISVAPTRSRLCQECWKWCSVCSLVFHLSRLCVFKRRQTWHHRNPTCPWQSAVNP